ncbi:MAG: DUF1905 domain-containing protein [Rhodothermales bacterium]|nr:DUF1905 domain-containing protein [Rhodothermales bacterium]
MREGTGKHELEAKIEKGRGGGAFVTIPFDVGIVFGAKGRVPVVATFDGEVYRGSIAPMAEHHVLGIVKEIRGKVGKDVGDLVQVVIKRDLEERKVDVPADLEMALRSDSTAREFFRSLSYTGQKEYARWITSARKAETRRRRIEKAVEMLADGRKL